MSEQSDIRRALEELSSHPPMRDRKREVHERIGVIRRRRNVLTGVTMSIFILLTAIAFAARPQLGGRPEDAALISASPSPRPTPVPAPTPPSPSPAAPASRAQYAASARAAKDAIVAPPPDSSERPASVSAPPKTGLASKSTRAAPPVADPPVASVANPPPSSKIAIVRPPTSAAPTTAVATTAPPVSSIAPTPTVSAGPSGSPTPSATPSGSVSSTPSASASPAAPETVTADITAVTAADGSTSPETVVTVRLRGSIYGSVRTVAVWYTTIRNSNYSDSQSRVCQPRTEGQLHDIDETYAFRTRYRAAGAQTVTAEVTTLSAICSPTSNPVLSFNSVVNIPVGSTLSNGVRPVTLFATVADKTGSRVTMQVGAGDQDGSVSAFSIDWGNGLVETMPGASAAACAATEGSGTIWPSVSANGRYVGPQVAPGTYTVTVTATSTGCDGRDAQTTTQVLTVTIP